MTISALGVGEPAPWFPGAIAIKDDDTVSFDELAGRHIVLLFFGSAARPEACEVLTQFGEAGALFDGAHALLLGISNDPEDAAQGRLRRQDPGRLFLLDANGVAAKQYRLAEPGATVAPSAITPTAFILNPMMQIVDIVSGTEPAAFVDRVVSRLRGHLASPPAAGNAPALVVPQVFDRAFCSQLVAHYDSMGGRELGSIERAGNIVERFDPKFRKRLDHYISDEHHVQQSRTLLERRLLPMVFRAFQFQTTRIERYLIGCYDAETGGYFRPHRDNTAPVVAHRRFAVTINLNDDYEGGRLRFPEFGPQTYCAPPGGAIVFSCSLLHEVLPVTRGRRYAFLSFIYDEASQRMRDDYARRTGARA